MSLGKPAAPPFLRNLELDGDAKERDVRRAYAAALKLIDQEEDRAEFQRLRENYEASLAWVRDRESAALRQHDDSPVSAAHHDLPAPSVQVETPARTQSAERKRVGDGPQATAQQVLEEFLKELDAGARGDRREVRALLETKLEDPRLVDMDARYLFEWGVASILAGGWRSGHENLFAPAFSALKWREDPSRLRGFGQAGFIVDNAIHQLEMYDAQTDAVRKMQRYLIRKLRIDRHPGDVVLIKYMPLVEHIASTFPHWLHIITNTSNISNWREWDTQVPRWRRKITGKPHGNLGKPRMAATYREKPASGGRWTGGFAVLAVIVTVGHFLSSKAPSSSAYNSSLPPLRPPAQYAPFGSQPPPQLPDPARFAASQRAAPADPPLLAALPEAKKLAMSISKGKADPLKCNDAIRILTFHAAEHEKGVFGRPFDRLMINCLMGKLAVFPYASIDRSIKREFGKQGADSAKSFSATQAPEIPAKAGRSFPAQQSYRFGNAPKDREEKGSSFSLSPPAQRDDPPPPVPASRSMAIPIDPIPLSIKEMN